MAGAELNRIYQNARWTRRGAQGPSSEGHYWHCPYGPTADPKGRSLMSPAFTVGNLDFDSDDVELTSGWFFSPRLAPTSTIR